MKKKNVFLLGLLVILLAMGLVLAGCSDDGSGDSGSSSSGGSSGGSNSGGSSSGGSNSGGSSGGSNSGGSSSGGSGTSAPSAPTGVMVAAASSSSISVSWNSVSGATGYYIYRSSTASGTYAQAGSSTSTSYTNTGLSASTAYYYKVAAYNSAGTSSQSSYVSATTSSSSSGGGAIEYRLDQPIFGTCSKSGTSLTINWSLKTSGKTPNGLYTYTAPSSIIIQIYDGSSFFDYKTLAASARTITLSSFSVIQYKVESSNRVTVRVLCKSGSSAYNDVYATTTYYVEQNTWFPTY